MSEPIDALLLMMQRVAEESTDVTVSARRHHEQQQKHRFENALARVVDQLDSSEFCKIVAAIAAESASTWDAVKLRVLLERLLRRVEGTLVGRQRELEIDAACASAVAALYEQWRDTPLPRSLWLALLLQYGDEAAWRQVAELISSDPPVELPQVAEALAPAWRRTTGPFQQLFPQLWQALEHRHVAVVVLDFANYLYRSQRLSTHPAEAIAPRLVALLGAIVDRLEGYETDCREHGVADVAIARQVQESVALAVALADTMALTCRVEATGKLYRMLDLSHRRARTEAAAALARLGDEAGTTALLALAAEPSVRLRVHAYARELGQYERIDPAFRSPTATAEAELVVRLAEPDGFGFPPTSLELFDERELFWPGYETKQPCYLFRFRYVLPQGEWTNIALARPTIHVCPADLEGFSVADLYAIYAGWHVEHEDLRRWEIDANHPLQSQQLEAALTRLENRGYSALRPAFLADYFGTRVVVVTAERAGQPGTAMVLPEREIWVPSASSRRPLDADTAFDLFVGRDLLTRFNPGYGDDDAAARAEV